MNSDVIKENKKNLSIIFKWELKYVYGCPLYSFDWTSSHLKLLMEIFMQPQADQI